jgi:hypothetical protein
MVKVVRVCQEITTVGPLRYGHGLARGVKTHGGRFGKKKSPEDHFLKTFERSKLSERVIDYDSGTSVIRTWDSAWN